MKRGPLTALVLALLIVAPSPPSGDRLLPSSMAHADQVLLDGVSYAWWNATWHMRVPVLVKPFLLDRLTNNGTAGLEGDRISNYPAEIEVDFTEAIRNAKGEARWPQDPLKRLSSFTLDTDSVRVVWYSQENGEVLRTAKGSDVVPATFTPALLENLERRTTIFDAGSNAIGTVTFILEGIFDSPRLYFIYFDILENGKKPAAVFSEEEMAPLDALYWLSRGTEFYGYAPADGVLADSPGPGTSLYVVSPYANTTVRLSKYPSVPSGGNPPEPYFLPGIGYTHVMGSALAGDPRGRLEIPILRGDPFFFKFESTRPVTLAVGQKGLLDGSADANAIFSTVYPSIDGPPVGKTFIFTPMTGHEHETGAAFCDQYPNNECTMAFEIVTYDLAANVQIVCLSCPVGTPPMSISVPRQSMKIMQGEVYPAFLPGALALVTSDAPISIHAAGYTKGLVGYQMHSQYGAPFGKLLVGTASIDFDVVGQGAGSVTAYEYLNPAAAVRGTFTAGAGGHSYNKFQPAHALDAPIYGFTSTASRISVTSGEVGIHAVGGVGGKVFEPVVTEHHTNTKRARAFAFAIYNDTRLSIYNYSSGDNIVNRTISQNTVVLNKAATTQNLMPVGNYRVTSNKPVFLYKMLEREKSYFTFYPGRLGSPLYEMGQAEYFGYLLAWKDDTRFVTNTLKPGDSAVFNFVVRNLARDVKGHGLSDSIGLSVAVDRDGWKTSLGAAIIENVSYLEEREVPVVLQVPSNASTGDSVTLTVTAQSVGNPNMKDRAQGLGTVQTKYEFEMKFVSNGKKEISRVIAAGASTAYQIAVKNTGTGDDVLTFSTTRGDRLGFNSTLLGPTGEALTDSFGKPAVTLNLMVGEEKVIVFNVSAPDTDQPIPFTATIQAVSENDASKVDQLAASTLINVESRIKVGVDAASKFILPRNSTVYPVEVTNLGAATTVKMTFSGAFPAGWKANLSDIQFPLEGQGKLDPLGNRLDVKVVNFTLTAPDAVEVGRLVQSRVIATSQLETLNATLPSDSVVLEAVVANNFTNELTAAPGKNLLPGEPISYEMQVKSQANGPFQLEINPAGLPAGWRYLGREPLAPQEMLPGESRLFKANFEMVKNAKPGAYNVSIGLTFRDERVHTTNLTTINFTALVKRLEVLSVEQEERNVLVAPGASRRVGLIVENVGNVNVSTKLGVKGPAGWEAFLSDPVDGVVALGPGETAAVNVTVRSPETFGERSPRFDLVTTLSGTDQAYPFNVTQIQYDLEIIDVSKPDRLSADEPVSFNLKVVNHGTAPATGVLIEMVIDGVALRNVTIESLPPEEPRTVQIPWTATKEAKTARFTVDPAGSYRETDEENNAVEADLSRSFSTPGPQVIYLLLSLAPAAFLRRRR
ncbi:MAG: hypothetical protein HY556_10995 [Euryarchaeota archaeon]|nr:hypothetical protein [Euryarchaeota archaeon]